MQRRRFIARIASIGAAAYTPMHRVLAASGDQVVRVRVVYGSANTLRDLSSLGHDLLGRVDHGAWMACPDQTVRALADHGPPIFLYFDRRAYDMAVANLSAAQVQDVIRRRRDHWAPQTAGHVMAWLLELERVSLEGALRAGLPVSSQPDKSLTLLQRMYELERYDRLPAKAMAVTVLEGESLLLSALQSALDSSLFDAAAEDKSGMAAHLHQRQAWVQAVCRAAGMLGAREYAAAPPFAEIARGVYVHPADEALERAFRQSGEAALRWRDGLVCVLAERRAEPLRAQGHRVEMLYADASEFYDSVDSLTSAQLFRDFAARLGRSSAESRRDILGQIDRLQLYQILMKRALRGRRDASQACASAGFDPVLREEVEFLAHSLRRTHTFSRCRGLDAVEPPLALMRAADEMEAADLSLFSAIAARYWPTIAQGLNKIERLKSGPG